MQALSSFDIIPEDALTYMVGEMFNQLVKPTANKLDAELIHTYVNLSRVSKAFARVVKQQVDDSKVDWQKVMERINHYWSTEMPVTTYHRGLLIGMVYHGARSENARKEIELFRQRHNILYRVKRTGKVYKGRIALGVKTLQAIPVRHATLKKQFHALLKKYIDIKTRHQAVMTVEEEYRNDARGKKKRLFRY